jgi:uncharacterized protein
VEPEGRASRRRLREVAPPLRRCAAGCLAEWMQEVRVAKEDRGFASMDRAKQREIASKGGKAAHAKGTAHEWTSEEAREAGRKGGMASHRRRKQLLEQQGGSASEPGPTGMLEHTGGGSSDPFR